MIKARDKFIELNLDRLSESLHEILKAKTVESIEFRDDRS